MSVPEISFRISGLIRNNYERLFRTAYAPKIRIEKYPNPILFLPPISTSFDTQSYSIFGRTLDLNKDIDWHYDLISKKSFPKKFSRSIDTRTEKNGIVKVVWEVNRLQFLTNICLQYHSTKDKKYLDQFVAIIRSWKAANPYLLGVNWYSNIEISLRIITWFLCWEILQVNDIVQKNPDFKAFVEQEWIPLIHLHAVYSHTHPSKFSSSNNHLIAEAAGLFIASVYWDLPGSASWAKDAQEILEREIILQHSENGINKEEASEYIQFITDFFLLALLVGERKGFAFSEKYKSRLHKIFQYIFHLMDASGNVPYYGDDDDGHTLVLKNQFSCNNFQSLLISGAILFKDPLFKSKSPDFDFKNQILFGTEGATIFKKIKTEKTPIQSKIYHKEGHIILKSGDEEKEIYLHIDAAPLGYLSIAAHGHADALSFFLHIDGFPFIADMGTYTYHSEPEWRAYFKGTLAHNTIRVDGLDQATNGGPCLWNNHYQTKVIKSIDNADKAHIVINHNAYYNIGVSHERSFQFDKRTKKIRILDTISSTDNKIHTYEISLHLDAEIEVFCSEKNTFSLTRKECKSKVLLKLASSLSPSIIKQSLNPILGWQSPSFLQKRPTNTIYSKLEQAGNFELETLIEII